MARPNDTADGPKEETTAPGDRASRPPAEADAPAEPTTTATPPARSTAPEAPSLAASSDSATSSVSHDAAPAPLREMHRRSWQSVWAVAAAVIVAAVIVGLVLDHDLAWVGVALVAAGTAATAEAAAKGKSTAFREFVFAERPPFSATASLKAEHLLRLASSADPYYQEVIPVSGAHRVQIVVESRSEHTVTIRAVRPVVVGRRPPRKGEPGVTAGILPEGQFEVLLDADPPRLQATVSASGNTVASLPIVLHPGAEGPVVVLTPRTDDYEVDWRLELDWSADDKEGTTTVGLGSKPFRATAEAGW